MPAIDSLEAIAILALGLPSNILDDLSAHVHAVLTGLALGS